MNTLMREQLNKCRIAKIPYVDDDFSGSLYIGKQVVTDNILNLNQTYTVRILPAYLESDKYLTITSSWNNDKKLNDTCLNIVVAEFLSDMVKVDAVGYDEWMKTTTNNVYLGYWIPVDSIEILTAIQS